jgi:ElaB/YqjD/DUF883 family membrane-anchored ribosome-binding protein
MSETIGAIQERLNPQRFRDQTKDAVYAATIGQAQQTAKGTGSTMLDTIKEHPIPALAAGLSIGYLFMKGSSSSSSSQSGSTTSSMQQHTGQMASQASSKAQQYTSEAQKQAQQYTSEAQKQAQHYSQQARQQAEQATDWFQQTLHQNPLAVGAAAIALGTAIGLSIPETQAEHKYMGETRDQLMEQAKSTVKSKAEDTMHKAQQVAEEAKNTAKEEAKHQGLA